MTAHDVVVVGAGISGVAFAHHAAAAGRRVLLLERNERLGGCLHSVRLGAGYWFELGAHTCYNSYGNFLDLVVGAGLTGRLVPRGEARKRFDLLDGDEHRLLTQAAVLRELSWREAMASLPRALARGRGDETVASWFSRLLGPRNYRHVLRPFLAGMPSQDPDRFPARGAGSLGFVKRRRRRKEFMRSFTVGGGLQTVCEVVAARPGIDVAAGVEVLAVVPHRDGLAVQTADGGRFSARVVAVAVDAPSAASMLGRGFPKAAAPISRIGSATVETVGVAVRREKLSLPEAAFIFPRHDLFHSVVTRDVVADPAWRGFAFHFKPASSRADRLRRAAAVLGLREGDLEPVAEVARVLPSPTIGHGDVLREIDRALEGGALAVTGNYFGAMSIEECVSRSRSEWERVAAHGRAVEQV